MIYYSLLCSIITVNQLVFPSVRADVGEAICQGYMLNVTGMSRFVLWLTLSIFRPYPEHGCFDDLNPSGI